MKKLALALALLTAAAGARAEDAPKKTTPVKPAAPSGPAASAPGKPGAAPAEPAKPGPQSKEDQQKAIRLLGLSVAESLKPFKLTPVELDTVLTGLRDGAKGTKLDTSDPQVLQVVSNFIQARTGQQPQGAPPPQPLSKDDTQKALRYLGLDTANRIKPIALTPPELDRFIAAIKEGASGKATLERNEANAKLVNAFLQPRYEAAAAKEKSSGDAYLEKVSKEKNAQKLPSGVIVQTVQDGSGPTPAATDTVKVHYVGTLVDGSVFDSSRARGQPAEFPLNGVIPCWTEALQKLKVGGRARIVCPSATAYGERGQPGIPPNSVLTFDVELLGIKGK